MRAGMIEQWPGRLVCGKMVYAAAAVVHHGAIGDDARHDEASQLFR
jgi:hypothetical protein